MRERLFDFLLVIITPKIVDHDPQYWISAILFTALVMYAWLRATYSKRLRQVLNAFFTSRMNLLEREESAVSNRVSTALSFLFIVIISLFFYQAIAFGIGGVQQSFSPFYGSSGILLYIKICFLAFTLYFVKMGLIYLLGLIFRAEKAASEYIFNIFLFNEILGLFLLPVTIIIAFLKLLPPDKLIYSGLLVILVIFAYRIFRSATANQNQNISKYYLFLYLCTLEIMPLVAILKAFIS